MFDNISEIEIAQFPLPNVALVSRCTPLVPVSNFTSSRSILSVLERRLAGSSLVLLCSVLQSLYYLTFFVLCKWRLWSRHTFFLWLISLSVSNCSNLIMYSFGFALTILKFPNCVTLWNIWAGHVYNFFFAVSYAHFPAMAFIRLLAVWKPTRTQDWFSLRRTVAMIAGLWLFNAVHVFVLLQFPQNWFYFNPVTIGWDASDAPGFSRFFTWYWLCYEAICVGISFPSYSVCYLKIRVVQRQRASKFSRALISRPIETNNNMTQNNTTSSSNIEPSPNLQPLQQTPRQSPAQRQLNTMVSVRKAERFRTAEKNLLLIGFALSAIMGIDIALWRTSILLFKDSKYAALFLTVVEIIMYGVDAIIILTLSKEVRTKVRKLWASSYSTTSL